MCLYEPVVSICLRQTLQVQIGLVAHQYVIVGTALEIHLCVWNWCEVFSFFLSELKVNTQNQGVRRKFDLQINEREHISLYVNWLIWFFFGGGALYF